MPRLNQPLEFRRAKLVTRVAGILVFILTDATKDSSPGEGDESPLWIVNTWTMMLGTKQPTPGEVHD